MSNKLGEFRRALRACVGKIVAYEMRHGFGATLVPTIEQVMRGARVHDHDLHAAFASDTDFERIDAMAAALAAPLIIPAGKGGKATALVSLRGIATYDCECQPYAYSTLLLSQTMNALAADPEIGTVILDIDSPGGSSTGVMEAADAIFAARESTRVVALVNPLCASAAYWVASQASEITAVPSADVGSIGVYLLHGQCAKMLDEEGIKYTFIFAKDSPYKVEGNAFEPLGDEARDYFQGEADACMDDFVKAVARGRGVPAAKVLSDFGQGRCMMAPMAKKMGMVDRVAPINAAMARWGISAATMQGRRRGEAVEQKADAGGDWEVAEGTIKNLPEIPEADGATATWTINDGPIPPNEASEQPAVKAWRAVPEGTEFVPVEFGTIATSEAPTAPPGDAVTKRDARARRLNLLRA